MSNVEHPWTLAQVDDLSLRGLINLRLAPDLAIPGRLPGTVRENPVQKFVALRRSLPLA